MDSQINPRQSHFLGTSKGRYNLNSQKENKPRSLISIKKRKVTKSNVLDNFTLFD